MSEAAEFALRALVIGAGATLAMDAWTLARRRLFGMSSLDYALVGRWIGHMPRGRFMHHPIGASTPVRGERVLGWAPRPGSRATGPSGFPRTRGA